MSLRTFHICFLIISSLLMLYISSWSYMMWNYYADNAYLSYLLFSVIALLVLVVYGQKFSKNYKYINEIKRSSK